MRRSAFAALMMLIAAVPSQAQPKVLETDGFGSLAGKVTLDETKAKFKGPASLVAAMMAHADKACCLDPKAKDIEKVDMTWVVDPKTRAVANVVVWVIPPPVKGQKIVLPVADKLRKREEQVIFDQPHCQYLPRVAAYQPVYWDNGKKVPTDQKLIFRNSAVVSHNVRVVGNGIDNDGFNVNLTPKSDYSRPKGKELNPQRLPLPVQCDIHTWMKAHLFVFDHPYYAVTKEDGSYEIPLVPAGAEVRVMAWHEGVGYVLTSQGSAKTIQKGKTTTLDFAVPYQ